MPNRPGVPATTLRFYGREGLLPAGRARIADLWHLRDRLTAALAHLRDLPARDVLCGPTCSNLSDPGPAPEPVIACSLDGGAYRDRIDDWHRLLASAEVGALPDGGRTARLPADRAEQVARLVVAEQRCCPFLAFRLELTGELVELTAHAPRGGEALVAELFDRGGTRA